MGKKTAQVKFATIVEDDGDSSCNSETLDALIGEYWDDTDAYGFSSGRFDLRLGSIKPEKWALDTSLRRVYSIDVGGWRR